MGMELKRNTLIQQFFSCSLKKTTTHWCLKVTNTWPWVRTFCARQSVLDVAVKGSVCGCIMGPTFSAFLLVKSKPTWLCHEGLKHHGSKVLPLQNYWWKNFMNSASGSICTVSTVSGPLSCSLGVSFKFKVKKTPNTVRCEEYWIKLISLRWCTCQLWSFPLQSFC